MKLRSSRPFRTSIGWWWSPRTIPSSAAWARQLPARCCGIAYSPPHSSLRDCRINFSMPARSRRCTIVMESVAPRWRAASRTGLLEPIPVGSHPRTQVRMTMNSIRWSVLTAAFCAGSVALSAPAQDFPAKQPVKLIVTFAPGGGSDTIARTLNTKMGEALGQTVIVENKAGAGGTIATDFVAKSPPDGYNVLFTVSSHSINQALMPTLPFDTERDLRGVTLIGALPQALAVHPSVPANNLREWIALGRKEPRYLQYATGGVGSPGHFAGALLQSIGKLSLVHVPYRGGGPAMADVIGNQVPAVLSTLSGILPHAKAGKLKVIALTSAKRSALLPDVAPIAE